MKEKKGLLSSMESAAEWIEKYVAPPLVKFGNQRHMAAIRSGLIRVIPFIIIGSIPLILIGMPFENVAQFIAPYSGIFTSLYSMSMGFMSLFLSVSIAAELAKSYKLEVATVSVTTLACYLIVVAPIDLATGTLSTGNFGAGGLFSVFLVAIIVAEVMRLCRDHNIGIKMPKEVPENISASFSALIPMAILLVGFWLISIVFGFKINDILTVIISPLLAVSDTWYAVCIAALITCLLWFVGIQGGSFTNQGVLYPFLLANLAANAEAFASGNPMEHIYTEPFVYNWIMIGGVGCTLPLVLFYWNSKSARLREVARLEIAPGLFNINEPIMFGVPIVLNPIMLIPFIGISLFGGLYGYIITKIGLISSTCVQTPWSIPPLIGPYLSTGGDWRAVVAQIILIILTGMMWYPFAKLWEKKCIEEEKGQAAQ